MIASRSPRTALRSRSSDTPRRSAASSVTTRANGVTGVAPDCVLGHGDERLVPVERPRARHQLEQDEPQAVDVARHRHRLAAQALGTRVLQRERLGAGEVQVGSGQLGGAEIEQLRPAVGDEDVARLQIEMDDQVATTAPRRRPQEQAQPLTD